MKSETAQHNSDDRARFDPDMLLNAPCTFFWATRYEGASTLHLTRAMRINRPVFTLHLATRRALSKSPRSIRRRTTCLFRQGSGGTEGAGCYRTNIFGAARMAVIQGIRRVPHGAGAVGSRKKRQGPVRKEAAGTPRRQRSCVASSPSTRKRRRSPEKNADPAELARYVMDCAARNAVQGADGRQSRSTTSELRNWHYGPGRPERSPSLYFRDCLLTPTSAFPTS